MFILITKPFENRMDNFKGYEMPMKCESLFVLTDQKKLNLRWIMFDFNINHKINHNINYAFILQPALRHFINWYIWGTARYCALRKHT